MIISSFRFVFPQSTSLSFYVSFILQVTINWTNWPAPNVWVLIAQLLEHCRANAEAMGLSAVIAPKNFLGKFAIAAITTVMIISSLKFVFVQFTSSSSSPIILVVYTLAFMHVHVHVMLPCAWAIAERWFGISSGTLLSMLLEVSKNTNIQSRQYITKTQLTLQCTSHIKSYMIR